MKIYRIITLVFLFILLFIPNQEKEYFRIISLIGLFSVFLLPVFIKNVRQDILRKNLVTIFFILFLIASAISTIFSIDQKRSIIQFLLFVSYFVVFTSIRSIFSSHRSKELFAICYLLFVIALSFIFFYYTFIRSYVNWQAEGVSFMWMYYGHSHLSAILIFAIPLSFYFLCKYWQKKFLNGLLLITNYILLFSLLFTFGFTSILSLGVSFIVILLVFGFLSPSKKIIVGAGIVLIFGLFLLGAFWLPGRIGFRKTYTGSAITRFVYWQNAIDNFKQKPLTGSGLDTFRIINQESPRQAKLGSFFAFNFFLQMLSDAGIFGFLTSLGLVFFVIAQCTKTIFNKLYATYNLKVLLSVFFIGIFASTLNTLVDFDWQMPTVFFIFWIFAGFFQSSYFNPIARITIIEGKV